MDYGTLRVATPDGQIREYPITTPTVVIGRADGNQVVIDHVSVSRRHAQLTIESGKVTIEDLGSNTGTFVAGQRVQANSQMLVEIGQTLRFGDVEARFTPDEALRGDAGPVARSAAQAATETEQTVAVSIIAPSEPLAPGSRANATVAITNRGTQTDELTLNILDLPAEWIRLSRPSVSLVPGARDEITVNIFPPRAAASKAGEYTFAASVTSKVHGREVRALAKLTVLPFEEFRATMSPVSSRKDFKISTSNGSNVPVAVEFSGTDPEEQLAFQFGAPSIELAPGEDRVVPLAVKKKKRKLFGKSVQLPFEVTTKPGGSLSPTTSRGQLQVKPPFERFSLPMLLIIVMGIIATGGLSYSRLCGSSWPICPRGQITLPSGGGGGNATATPTTAAAAPTTAVAATPTPTGLYVGGRARVINSDPNPPNNTNCLAVRSGDVPVIDPGNVQDRLCTGTVVEILDGPTQAGAFTWWRVRGQGMSGNQVSGWAAERRTDGTSVPFLEPTP